MQRICLCLGGEEEEEKRSTPEEKIKKTVAPFGAWESPLTAEFVTKAGVGLDAPACSADGKLHWLEMRSEEAGRTVVCRQAAAGEKASDRGGIDVTPAESNVRTLVHEYGGRGHLLVTTLPEGGVIYSNFKDQRLMWLHADGNLTNLLPAEAYPEDGRYRFADFALDVTRRRLICVREDHTAGGGDATAVQDIVNTICAVSLDGSGKMSVLAQGCDFYVAPRISLDGSKLAYICWKFPSMPWDATELSMATLDEAGAVVGEPVSVCGGPEANVSVLQPAWSPGGDLHFVCDKTGWYNLYKHTDAGTTNLTPFDREYSGDHPGWMLGHQNYCFVGQSRIAITYKQPDDGANRLVLIDPATSHELKQEVLSSRSVRSMSPSPDGKTLYFIGGDPRGPSGIFRLQLPGSQVGGPVPPAVKVVSSANKGSSIDSDFISLPQLVSFATPIGGSEIAHAFYYPPTNPNFAAPPDTKPPLLVRAHGGPTACTSTAFSPQLQFWTSRGYAILDVDYRGSSGYGRAYTQRQKDNFGVVDVEDVCAGAQYLVDKGLVNPKHLAIDGGSAGGYTTLAALTFKNVFTAGCSLFGIGDLKSMSATSNKFESHYMDSLIGNPSMAAGKLEEVMAARSPVKHLDKLDCPILLLHGTEDKCVPVEQSEMMYEAVKAKGIPCCLQIYPGEQHGFRKSENIQDSLIREFAFFGRIFGFKAPGMPAMQITNLD